MISANNFEVPEGEKYIMNVVRLILLCASLLLINGCATSQVPFQLQPALNPDKAVIYIYRPASMANIMVNPRLQMNEKPGLEIKNAAFYRIEQMPGPLNLQLILSDRYIGEHKLQLQATANQLYFVRVTTQLKFEMNKPYTRTFNIESVDESVALQEMASLKTTTKASNVADAETPIEGLKKDAEAETQFSTSKTRNPFSK